jgi:hypothetical protein
VRENGKLLSRVHENRGNILVYARVRPPTNEEVEASDALEVVQILSDTELAFYDSGKRYASAARLLTPTHSDAQASTRTSTRIVQLRVCGLCMCMCRGRVWVWACFEYPVPGGPLR